MWSGRFSFRKSPTYNINFKKDFLTKSGTVVPVGARNYTSTGYNFENSCLSDTGYGWGCAAWVIENENMDYWHCDDLSWDGKHKCSK